MSLAVSSWAFSRGLCPYVRRRDAFAPGYCAQLRQDILDSPYLAANNLNYRFSGTRGWSVIFRGDGVERVFGEFPSFRPYLEAVLDGRCNAFFLNPLVMGRASAADGSARPHVAPHVDRSLRSLTRPVEPPDPRRVTVLYVDVPTGMRGGLLRLYHRILPIGTIRPERNLLLEFRGSLRHEVTPVEFAQTHDALRVSLVCEHYRFSSTLLERVPPYTVRSMSSFDAFLDVEMDRD